MLKFTNTADRPYPVEWPPEKFHLSHRKIKKKQALNLQKLIENNVKETEIDNFLRDNPNILVNCLRSFSTGHHGAWVIPQQQIKPPMASKHKGLIPDYIIGGKSSDGVEWFVLELKGVSDKLFTKTGKLLYLSSVLNKAVCQTMEYIDYCSSQQSYLREILGLNSFREPKGLILIGRENEFKNDERARQLKAAWNRYLGNKIEIRSYDSMLRYVKSEIELKNKEKKS